MFVEFGGNCAITHDCRRLVVRVGIDRIDPKRYGKLGNFALGRRVTNNEPATIGDEPLVNFLQRLPNKFDAPIRR